MELVKMSKKGQLVVPKEIRDKLKLSPEDRFIALGEKDYVVFKRVKLPQLRKEFEKLAAIASEIAAERGISAKDVKREIETYRAGK